MDGERVELKIKSDCVSIQELAGELGEVNVFQCGRTFRDSIIFEAANECLRHLACLVPAAIARTIEVETGMALPGKSSISVQKVS